MPALADICNPINIAKMPQQDLFQSPDYYLLDELLTEERQKMTKFSQFLA